MKFLRYIYIFLLGLLCFFVSQVLLRMPLMALLYKEPSFNIIIMKYPIINIIILSVSAGIFEETFRFLLRFLIKDSSKISDPIIFGFGHSLMEIMYLLTPIIINFGISVITKETIIERIIATIYHIDATILIWNGFKQNKKFLFLILSIVLHSIVNMTVVIAANSGLNIIGVEFIFLILVIFITFITLKLNKLEVK